MKTAWVLTGDGINCEVETAEACARAGFETRIWHLADLLEKRPSLAGCSLLVIPGGFSFGDELGSGRVLALKLRYQLEWDLLAFARTDGLVLGICNGFQTLMALGAFGAGVTLAANEDGRFRNEWCRLDVEPTIRSPFLEGIEVLELPIRHGEGRLLFAEDRDPASRHHAVVALRYVTNPNGSTDRIAGLAAADGRILGLMPHPEAFARASQHPAFHRVGGDPLGEGAGLEIFHNAFRSARSPQENHRENYR